MARLGSLILQAIADSLGLPQNHFAETICENHLGLLRLFHYPAEENPEPNLWGVG
jgi:isopenicillin N synthase-like dioxygenase